MHDNNVMPIEEMLHEDEFTGRVEILREFESWVEQTGRVGAGSNALIAPRRMGKTVLLDRLVNIIFYKPEYRVAPFYIKFKREETTLRKFLLVYAAEFFRQYIAYCLQDAILWNKLGTGNVFDITQTRNLSLCLSLRRFIKKFSLRTVRENFFIGTQRAWQQEFSACPQY